MSGISRLGLAGFIMIEQEARASADINLVDTEIANERDQSRGRRRMW